MLVNHNGKLKAQTMTEKIRIGVSSCLLGNEVRYDGGHKRDRYITDVLGAHLEFVPVCPEVEVGFGVPRETLRLEGDIEAPRLMTTRTRIDHTDRMQAWARRRVRELEKEALCGYIFKKGSPSSGMMRVKVYTSKNQPVAKGVGLFARAFMGHFPLLPVEEEGRLHDPVIRENFIERIFTLKRWRDCLQGGRRFGRLVSFHTRHKLLILSHSTKAYQTMGRLVAQGKPRDSKAVFDAYEELLMDALSLNATVKKNVNVLQHMAGYFKKMLSQDEKRELQELIDQYHKLLLPLIVPVTLINHYVRKYDQAYLKEQVYLNPHPVELKLRNHA
jgi:uncharacterized protein YbgA (DUF1722 family)/uncharacterized protein YbbK (DUF523 family)